MPNIKQKLISSSSDDDKRVERVERVDLKTLGKIYKILKLIGDKVRANSPCHRENFWSSN